MKTTSMISSNTFRFLNQAHALPDSGGWNDSTLEKLWLYNLHYFDDLNASDAPSRRSWHQSLLIRWISENPPGHGNGWEPYPTSLRIVNWVKWAVAGNSLPRECIHSLAVQAHWLMQRLEWHLLGNHLFANAKALTFAGLFFQGKDAEGWLATGLKILRREIGQQVLADGGHFERSPMYHAIILEDLLDLINAAGIWPEKIPSEVRTEWKQTAQRMLVWMKSMSHPDSEIGFFNDSAFGIAPNFDALREYADRFSILTKPAKTNCLSMRDSGYVRLENSAAVVLLDVAPVGPDYLPGHAHADTLSFELSLFDQRVVVNGGTSCYGAGAQRLYERGTAAHSTVEIDGQNSSEVWGGFRVARRAYPFALEIENDGDLCTVTCSHDGYRRLRGSPIHSRSWTLVEGSLLVKDTVVGDHGSAIARFHLHPDVRIVPNGDRQWLLHFANGRVAHLVVLEGIPYLAPSFYAPEFGLVRPAHCIEVRLVDSCAVTRINWTCT